MSTGWAIYLYFALGFLVAVGGLHSNQADWYRHEDAFGSYSVLLNIFGFLLVVMLLWAPAVIIGLTRVAMRPHITHPLFRPPLATHRRRHLHF